MKTSPMMGSLYVVVLFGATAFAGQWSYNPETTRLRHDESGWILRAEAHGKSLEITDRVASPTSDLPLNDPVADGFFVESITGGLGENPDLKSLVLPDTLKQFGTFRCMVWQCPNLTHVDLGKTPSANLEFGECVKLASIVVHSDNPAYKTIDGVVFSKDGSTLVRCPPALQKGSYAVPDTVTNIHENAFAECVGLSEMILPESVRKIGFNAFNGCTQLKRIRLPVALESFGNWAFANCTQLETIVLPESLRMIPDSGFVFCENLRRVTFPSRLDPNGIGGQAFRGCSKLDEVFLPDGPTKLSEYAFADCRALRTLRLPDTLTCIYESSGIFNSPFKGCSSLETLALPKSMQAGGTLGIFTGCDALARFTVEEGHEHLKSDGGVIYSRDGSILVRCSPEMRGEFTIPNGTQEILADAFADCRKLTVVHFPEGLRKIGATAFFECSALEVVVLPDSVTEIGNYAFEGCSALRTVRLPPDLAAASDKLFSRPPPACLTAPRTGAVQFSADGLSLLYYPPDRPDVSYVVPAGTKSIGASAFIVSKMLERVEIPNSVTNIGHGAFMCGEKLAFVRLPANLKTISDSIFYGCSRLAAVILPKATEVIGESAFWRSNLRFETLQDSIRSIGSHAFTGVHTAATLHLPVALESIGVSAFEGCPDLEHVTVPDGVTSIGAEAFSDCPKLKSLIFNGPYPHFIGREILRDSNCATTYVARAFGASWDTDVSFGPIGAMNSIWQGHPIVYVSAEVRRHEPPQETEATTIAQSTHLATAPATPSAVATGVHAVFVDSDRDGMSDADEAIAGTNPFDPDSIFRALILVKDGAVVIHWTPDLGDKRIYTIEGKVNLADKMWMSPAPSDCRFFRVLVELPPDAGHL